MNVWIRCSRCGHQDHQAGIKALVGDCRCPKCGGDKIEMKIGAEAPDWYKASDAKPRLPQ